MFAGFSKWVIEQRKYLILGALIITLVSGYFIRSIKVNPDFTSYLPKSDPVVRLFDHIGEEYGGNLLALIALEADDIFDAGVIRDIDRITRGLKTISGVSYVTSITNILDIRSDADGIEVSRLIDEYDLPETNEELDELKEYALAKEMYRGRLISEDATATLIICRLQPDADEAAIAQQIKTMIGQSAVSGQVYFGGMPFMMQDVSNMIIDDLKLLLPLVALLTALILYLGFRSPRGVLLPLIAVGISTTWTIGLMCALCVPVSLVSNIIPVILFAVGSAYSIHVISRLDEDPSAGDTSSSPTQPAAYLSGVILPVILAAFTTMVGFLSFVFGSYLTTIREFGIFATLGVFFSCIISITLVPALASYMKPKKQRKRNGPDERTRGRVISKITAATLKHPLLTLALSLVLIVIALLGVPRIERNVDILDYFKPGTEVRRAENLMKEKFGGSTPVQILVKGDILEPEVLMAMKRFQEFLESHADISHAQSVADLVEEMSFVVGEGRAIPGSRAKIANLWFLLEGEEIVTQMVNPQMNEAIIQATVGSSLQTDRVKVIVDGINEYIAENNTTEYSFEQTGMPSIHYRLDENIKQSLVSSIVLATTAVFITVLLLLRSLRGGLIGLVPIAFSLLGIFGFMGILRIPLDIATVLVGGVSIGIGIDYSIHFLGRFRREQARMGNTRDALQQTLQTTGRAISINVIAVTAGFLVLLLANLVPLQRFGILVAITMLASGYGALLMLPAIIILTKPVFGGRNNNSINEVHIKRSAK
ncbi:RND family transporter [candidate division WOR-3 bacterium]|nr:RND family transporter [candidate division WOR-3 bacterium]